MPIPKNISQEHVLKAIEEIDKEGIPENRESRTWLLVYNGQVYPPKYVITLANKYANDEFLDPAEFNTHGTIKYLRRLGFRVAKITPETGGDSGSNITEYPPDEFDRKMYSVF